MNEEKFTGKAQGYAKYRPTYPEAFIQHLYSKVGLNAESVVADVGSGTGILTRLLLDRGSTVYGVEPNAQMRSVAETSFSDQHHFKSVDASAEHTRLSDASVDFVTVAQAFHWFDPQAFRLECLRILKEQGKVILVWNSRDAQSDLVMENDVVNRAFCPHFKGFSGGMRGESPDAYSGFFKDGNCDYKYFRHDLHFNEEQFIGRNLSASYAPKEADDTYTPYVTALKELYKKYSVQESLVMPNITRSYVGEV